MVYRILFEWSSSQLPRGSHPKQAVIIAHDHAIVYLSERSIFAVGFVFMPAGFSWIILPPLP
jgi:hypothetical protein